MWIVLMLAMVFLGISAYLFMSVGAAKTVEGHDPLPDDARLPVAVDAAAMSPSQRWTLGSIRKEFDWLKDEIHMHHGDSRKPAKGEAVRGFFSRLRYAYRLTLKEKEIITFALLQWTSIAIGYYLWVQMLDWIPAEVWKSAAESDEGSIADYVLMAWSFVCVGVAAFPLSIFSACMGAVHFLHRQGRPSTIAACLRMVLPKAWPLWMFQWIDGWITVERILDRLPKEDDDRTPQQKAVSEALYYAWKLGTIGILPSLVTGRGLVEACRQSVSVVKNKFRELSVLRLGYSAVCWVIGIAAYAGTIVFFIAFNHLLPGAEEEIYGQVFVFYYWAGVPILVSVAIIQLFVRPVYIISACDIYSDFMMEQKQTLLIPRNPPKNISAIVAFVLLCVVLGTVYLLRYELGIMDMLATPYGQEYPSR